MSQKSLIYHQLDPEDVMTKSYCFLQLLCIVGLHHLELGIYGPKVNYHATQNLEIKLNYYLQKWAKLTR